MTERAAARLEAALEVAIRSVPGVTGLYRTGSSVAKLIDASAALLRGQQQRSSLVRVDDGTSGVTVTAAVGVDSAVSSVQVLELASTAVTEAVTASQLALEQVHLTVVHVNGDGLRS